MRYSSRRAFLTSVGTAAAGPIILGRRAFAQNPLSESMPSRCDSELMHSVSSDDRGAALSLTGSVGSPIPKRISQVVST